MVTLKREVPLVEGNWVLCQPRLSELKGRRWRWVLVAGWFRSLRSR